MLDAPSNVALLVVGALAILILLSKTFGSLKATVG